MVAPLIARLVVSRIVALQTLWSNICSIGSIDVSEVIILKKASFLFCDWRSEWCRCECHVTDREIITGPRRQVQEHERPLAAQAGLRAVCLTWKGRRANVDIVTLRATRMAY